MAKRKKDDGWQTTQPKKKAPQPGTYDVVLTTQNDGPGNENQRVEHFVVDNASGPSDAIRKASLNISAKRKIVIATAIFMGMMAFAFINVTNPLALQWAGYNLYHLFFGG